MLDDEEKNVNKLEKALKKLKQNDLEAALKLFIEYSEAHPKDPIGYINVGNVLFQLKQIEEAERFYLKAIELDDTTATAYYGLGNLYYNQEKYDYAEKMFTHCLSLGLKDADVYYLLGMTYMKRDQLMVAVPFLQRASEIEKKEEFMFQYGLALAKLHYYKEARHAFLELIKYNPKYADALYNLGILAFHANNLQDALDYFEKTIAIQNNHTLAKEAKQHVEKTIQRNE